MSTSVMWMDSFSLFKSHAAILVSGGVSTMAANMRGNCTPTTPQLLSYSTGCDSPAVSSVLRR
jgi:hypothetical protein